MTQVLVVEGVNEQKHIVALALDDILTRQRALEDALLDCFHRQVVASGAETRALVDLVGFWTKVGEGSVVALGHLLYLARTYWSIFPDSFTQRYNGSYAHFAGEVSGGRARGTTDNFINIFVTFFSGLREINAPEWFDPSNIVHSKLLLCTGTANRSEMSEELWEKLQDPTVTDEVMRVAIRRQAGKIPWPSDPTFYLQLDSSTGELLVIADSNIFSIGVLRLEARGEPVVDEALTRLIDSAKIRVV